MLCYDADLDSLTPDKVNMYHISRVNPPKHDRRTCSIRIPQRLPFYRHRSDLCSRERCQRVEPGGGRISTRKQERRPRLETGGIEQRAVAAAPIR